MKNLIAIICPVLMNKRVPLILLAVLTMGNRCSEVDVTDQNVANTMIDLNNYWR